MPPPRPHRFVGAIRGAIGGEVVNKTETALLLKFINYDDKRKVTVDDVEFWHTHLMGIPYADALEAVKMHQESSSDWIKVSHVKANLELIYSRRERQRRIAAGGMLQIVETPADTSIPLCPEHGKNYANCPPCYNALPEVSDGR